MHQQHGRRLPPIILLPDFAANIVQEEQLGKIGPLLESHQRRDKALVELERLDEVRPKVFSEGGYVNYKEVRGCWPEQQQAPACSCAVLLFQSAKLACLPVHMIATAMMQQACPSALRRQTNLVQSMGQAVLLKHVNGPLCSSFNAYTHEHACEVKQSYSSFNSFKVLLQWHHTYSTFSIYAL